MGFLSTVGARAASSSAFALAATNSNTVNGSVRNPSNSIGFSFSPGGLLLPYHMGVADCLVREKYIDPSETVLAGSSAGSIATMAIGCGLDPVLGLEGTIAISDRCIEQGKTARGNLLPLLEEQMESLVGEEEFAFLQERRSGVSSNNVDDKTGTGIALAYREVFPRRKSHFQTRFQNRQELFRSVGYSCMFPFFTTNFPCIVDFSAVTGASTTSNDDDEPQLPLPRVLMDGYFSVPRAQFGCPVLEDEFPDSGVDRTVAITCIPQDKFGMEEVFGENNKNSNNIISINDAAGNDPLGMVDIVRIATQPTSRKELTDLFERGYRDAERWCRIEEENQKEKMQKQR